MKVFENKRFLLLVKFLDINFISLKGFQKENIKNFLNSRCKF